MGSLSVEQAALCLYTPREGQKSVDSKQGLSRHDMVIILKSTPNLFLCGYSLLVAALFECP